jgi:SAM-dependent methyltransferase
MKRSSPACERNRGPILEALKPRLRAVSKVLEIGSGTGQHAAFFGAAMPWLVWQTSDLPENHPGIRAWLEETPRANLPPPLALDVSDRPWPVESADCVFSANTAHIMSWPEIESMFDGVSDVLPDDGLFCLYGPFVHAGRHVSESNRAFDESLRARAPHMGIRELRELETLAAGAGLLLEEVLPMPANNHLLVWRPW